MRKSKPAAVRIIHLLGNHTRAEHPPPPTGLSYYGGPLIQSVQIHTIFWGAAWQTTEAALLARINQFFQYVVTSPLIDQLQEYNVGNYAIGHGALASTKTITVPPPAVIVSDAQIQSLVIQNKVAVTHPPPPVPNDLYFVFTPPGVQVTMGGGASCTSFCGYHDDISGATLYAVIPFPNCAGCGGGLAVFDAITMFSSHELCEAITDPVPGTGWYGQVQGNQGEIGDFCNQLPKSLGGYTVQRMWSNRAGGCV